MKGYKGFKPGMICRGKQYQEHTEFTEPRLKSEESGMHFCSNPFGVWMFYPPADETGNLNEFAEVEAMDDPQTDDNSIYRSYRLRIGAKLDLYKFIKAGADFIFGHVKSTNSNTGYQSVATNTDDQSAATNTGKYSAVTSTGDLSAATGTSDLSAATSNGDYSAATNTGDRSAAISDGKYSAATNTGDYSAAINNSSWSAATSTGKRSVASNDGYRSVSVNTGIQSAAINKGNYSISSNTDDQSAATNDGYRSVSVNTGNCGTASTDGSESFAITTGYKGKVKGAIGCWIACAEWAYDGIGSWFPVDFKAIRVDGEKIKADTWYRLEEGKFIEVEEG